MSNLTNDQIQMLDEPLDWNRVLSRPGPGGGNLPYLPGYSVIDKANEIFGYGKWGYDILENTLETIVSPDGKMEGIYYRARVRLQVAGCQPAPAQPTNIVRFACVNYDLAPMTWLELDELQERVERAGCDLYHRYTTGKLNKESYKKYDAENTAIIEAIQDQKAALLDDSDETMESLDDRADWMAA